MLREVPWLPVGQGNLKKPGQIRFERMKQKQIELSRKYVKALCEHLRQRSPETLKSALHLGREAVVLKLETLELARIHEAALNVLKIHVH